MDEVLTITFVPRDQQKSEFDWANIQLGDKRAGKARCLLDNNSDTVIIFSINIFQEFEGRGIGKEFVELCKKQFKTVVADRVRFTAIGFWEKLGFTDDQQGNWVFSKKNIAK